jgi:transposase
MLIVGIDIAKHTHEACVIDETGKVLGGTIRFANTGSGADRLMKHIARYNPHSQEVVVGMEATGHYWLALNCRLLEAGFDVKVINPIQSDALRNLYIRQTKTDAIDALIIAQVIRFGEYSQTALAEPDIQALRMLCRYRLNLVDQIADLKRRIIAIMDQLFPEYENFFSDMFGRSSKEILAKLTSPEEILQLPTEQLSDILRRASRGRFADDKAAGLKALAQNSFGVKVASFAMVFQVRQQTEQIIFLEEQLEALDSQITSFYERFQCTLHTIPGVGTVLGATILSEIGDISRFSSPEKLVAFAGIDPTLRQSGAFFSSDNHMSKRGSPYLRRAVWLAAFVAAFNDPSFSAFYRKKIAEGKAHRVAIGAVSRKLLHTIYAILRSGDSFVSQSPP